MKRNPELGLFILRVATGLVFFTHGWPKLIGGGVSGTAQFFGQIGIPLAGVAAWLVTLLEFFGGLALIAGLFVPYLSVLFSIEMVVAALLVHMKIGWYVVGPGQGGVEFNVLLIASLLMLWFGGSGMASLDAMWASRKAERPATAEPQGREAGLGPADRESGTGGEYGG